MKSQITIKYNPENNTFTVGNGYMSASCATVSGALRDLLGDSLDESTYQTLKSGSIDDVVINTGPLIINGSGKSYVVKIDGLPLIEGFNPIEKCYLDDTLKALNRLAKIANSTQGFTVRSDPVTSVSIKLACSPEVSRHLFIIHEIVNNMQEEINRLREEQ